VIASFKKLLESGDTYEYVRKTLQPVEGPQVFLRTDHRRGSER